MRCALHGSLIYLCRLCCLLSIIDRGQGLASVCLFCLPNSPLALWQYYRRVYEMEGGRYSKTPRLPWSIVYTAASPALTRTHGVTRQHVPSRSYSVLRTDGQRLRPGRKLRSQNAGGSGTVARASRLQRAMSKCTCPICEWQPGAPPAREEPKVPLALELPFKLKDSLPPPMRLDAAPLVRREEPAAAAKPLFPWDILAGVTAFPRCPDCLGILTPE